MSTSLFDFAFPDRILARTADGEYEMVGAPHGGGFSGHGVEGRVHAPADDELAIDLEGAKSSLFSITLEWRVDAAGWSILADAWERAYGDLRWRVPGADGILAPWYFAAAQPDSIPHATAGTVGVKTGGASMAGWHIAPDLLRLKLDVRSGNRPLRFRRDHLRLATIVLPRAVVRSRWSLQHDLKRLCDHPRLARAPVYGINDWYYAYGNNTAERILEDSKRAGGWAGGLRDRPFSVIDDGWSASEGTWSRGNAKFPDMPGLAEAIRKAGCRPGLWVRPLLCDEQVPDGWLMAKDTLDPSVPEALQHVHDVIYRIHEWGFELIKHDYSTFDVCEHWGFQMTDGVAGRRRTFTDESRTTAEILRKLYEMIQLAAGSSLVLGCNTVGHLAAGLEELQRIGDDTSGREWARTVKMGVNSLAYRGAQQGAFYEADPDCVAVTTDVAWKRTQEWLELVAHSGTVLFVSAQQDAVGAEQEAALKAAFAAASKRRPIALAHGDGLAPTEWTLDGKSRAFDWS